MRQIGLGCRSSMRFYFRMLFLPHFAIDTLHILSDGKNNVLVSIHFSLDTRRM